MWISAWGGRRVDREVEMVGVDHVEEAQDSMVGAGDQDTTVGRQNPDAVAQLDVGVVLGERAWGGSR
ncbi:hypothetical protein U3653_28350 [Nocardia sp. CDC186]|uniref:Uncharacterized protein n=1 Tax=Nocardia implantans TaxID=3108168 RepID=A0ABU6B2Q2_9NOCA|nr:MULTISPECIES: hypothetical protein [unclassified Nocardia]MBF6195910.1 hypothetical protein [Nocardia beijingensis]MEA3531790.1 hypothetical protein [Nocardia sp. CDC192]MEB3513955.1 hypothetical protein [Nocardia sp. CDC186]